MQIEAGKYYRTRDGRKVGPLRATDNSFWPMESRGTWWRANGESCEGSMARMRKENDIIAEWSEGPVRTETVTKRRIVPGVYGGVYVSVGVEGKLVGITVDQFMTAEELDSLAMVASQLAEALRDVD